MNALLGKVAIVTEAKFRRGLGRVSALQMARDGAEVVIGDPGRPLGPQFPGGLVGEIPEMESVAGEIDSIGRVALLTETERPWARGFASAETIPGGSGRWRRRTRPAPRPRRPACGREDRGSGRWA